MNAHEPGTVARIDVGRDHRDHRDLLGLAGWNGSWGWVRTCEDGTGDPPPSVSVASGVAVSNIRPLIVLELDDPALTVAAVRSAVRYVGPALLLAGLASQIEAQITPPVSPTPEPTGRFAVVTDADGREGLRHGDGGWRDIAGVRYPSGWSQFTQPVTVHYAGLDS